MRGKRSLAAHKDGWEFRNVIALETFLHMFEVIQAEAHYLSGLRYWQCVAKSGKGAAGRSRSALCKIGKRSQIAFRTAQPLTEIMGRFRIRFL
jgi:hypothetical protein